MAAQAAVAWWLPPPGRPLTHPDTWEGHRPMMLRRRHRATSTEDVATLDTSKYDGLKKADLQKLLEERDLPKSGKVDELVQRLAEHDAENAAGQGGETPAATDVKVTDEVGETVQPEVQTGGLLAPTETVIAADGPEAIVPADKLRDGDQEPEQA